MARPIPANPAGLQRRYTYEAVARPFVPAQPVPRPVPRQVQQPAPAARPHAAGQEDTLPWEQLLLLVSALTGGLAIVAALELWPPLALAAGGLDERGAFYLLMGGVYVLATALYAAWRTRLLRDLDGAPWDARLMAYANLGVGGAVSLAMGLLTLVAVAAAALLIGLIVLLLSGGGDR